ncbi:hypothetical protein CCON61_01265 [Campylobacter concisus]|nr:hypothetical protein CCON61_01265 [Campylobacter concisus]
MAYYWVSQGAYDTCKDLPLNKCPITHLNHDTANRMWWAVRNHLGYKGENNTHGLYVLRHTVASRLVSLKGFNAHKLMAFMGHTDLRAAYTTFISMLMIYVMVWGLVLSEKMVKVMGIWLRRTDLNRRPSGYER